MSSWLTSISSVIGYAFKWIPLTFVSEEVQKMNAENEKLKILSSHTVQMKTLDNERLQLLASSYEASEARREREDAAIRQYVSHEGEKLREERGKQRIEKERQREHEKVLKQMEPVQGLTTAIIKNFSSIGYHQNSGPLPLFMHIKNRIPNEDKEGVKISVVTGNVGLSKVAAIDEKSLNN